MADSNIIRIQNDLAEQKGITIKEAAEILDLTYDTARRRIYNSGEIGFFDYGGGVVRVVKEDVIRYKKNHYIKPKRDINVSKEEVHEQKQN